MNAYDVKIKLKGIHDLMDVGIPATEAERLAGEIVMAREHSQYKNVLMIKCGDYPDEPEHDWMVNSNQYTIVK